MHPRTGANNLGYVTLKNPRMSTAETRLLALVRPGWVEGAERSRSLSTTVLGEVMVEPKIPGQAWKAAKVCQCRTSIAEDTSRIGVASAGRHYHR